MLGGSCRASFSLLGQDLGRRLTIHHLAVPSEERTGVDDALDGRGVGGRVLGDEVDADALRPDHPDRELDRVAERLRGAVEQQVRLDEEEDQLGPVLVPDLR
ncbi:MAG: hypothetical protein WEB03_02895 [Nitriliruptor sp.]